MADEMQACVAYSLEIKTALNKNKINTVFLSRNHKEYQNFDEKNPCVDEDTVNNLIDKYKWTYLRWCDGENYEQYKKDLYKQLGKFVNFLKFQRVELLYIDTSSPHHVDTLLFCIASELRLLKIVYFYRTVFEGTVIPILQYGPYEERNIIRDWNDNFFFKDIYESFKSNFYNKLPPSTQVTRTTTNTNFYFALIYAIFYTLRKKIGIKIKGKKLFLIEEKYNQNSVRKSLKYIIDQYYYIKRISVISKAQTKNAFIYFGNFQPEATTFPEAIPYHSITETLRQLRVIIPDDDIFFKEHPSSNIYFERGHGLTKVGIYRNRQFLNELKKLKIKILKDYKDDETNKVICVNGTLTIERYIKGEPCLTVTDNWFTQLLDVPTGLNNSIMGKKNTIADSDLFFTKEKEIAMIKAISKSTFYLSSTSNNHSYWNNSIGKIHHAVVQCL